MLFKFVSMFYYTYAMFSVFFVIVGIFSPGLAQTAMKNKFESLAISQVESDKSTNISSIKQSNGLGSEADDDYNKYAKYCEELDPTVPDFSAPGKRLAQVRCEEQKWRINYTNEIYKRKLKCTYYQITKLEKETGERRTFSFGGIGGRAALDGKFPHVVALGWKSDNASWLFRCSGFLVSSKYVLTAAHCTDRSRLSNTDPEIVRLGDTHLGPRPFFSSIIDYDNFGFWIDVKIKRIMKHPDYIPPKKYNDIALLELEEEVEFTKYVQPACLWYEEDLTKLGKNLILTEWKPVQMIIEDTKKTATILQATDAVLTRDEICNRLAFYNSRCSSSWCGVKNHQFCMGKTNNTSSGCDGFYEEDVGSLLQAKIELGLTPLDDEVVRERLSGFENIKDVDIHYVFGVKTLVKTCGKNNQYYVYTKISNFLDWIENIVWKN